jgi:hypothetical protein
MDLCDDPREVVFDESTTVCQPGYQSASSGYCDVSKDCTRSAEVNDSITALQYDYQSASCQLLADGTASCYCQSVDMGLSFDMEASSVDNGTCTRALEICTSGEELALSGPVECERSFQSAGPQYCDTQLRCGQAATINDQSLVAYGDLYVSCQILASGGPATCFCNSGQESASFEVDATSAWDVCNVAAERCPDLVEVQIGYGGTAGYYGPGSSLPEARMMSEPPARPAFVTELYVE